MQKCEPDFFTQKVILMIKGLENLPDEERRKELGLFPLEKAWGEPHRSIPVLKGQLQRGQRLCLHKEPHGEDKGRQVQVSLGEVSSRHKKRLFFTVRTIIHWKNFSITGDFQDAVGRGAR